MYNICQNQYSGNNINNNRNYNQKSQNDYYCENSQIKNYKLRNFKKLDKNISRSMEKINIDNIYSFKKAQSSKINNNSDEDLDIELEAISTKIPINDFYIDNNERGKERETSTFYDYSETKYKYNNMNEEDFKACSPLFKKMKSKIQRHISHDNLHTQGIISEKKYNNNFSKFNKTKLLIKKFKIKNFLVC